MGGWARANFSFTPFQCYFSYLDNKNKITIIIGPSETDLKNCVPFLPLETELSTRAHGTAKGTHTIATLRFWIQVPLPIKKKKEGYIY